MTREEFDKNVEDLNRCLRPLIDRLELIMAENDIRAFRLLLTGVEYAMSRTLQVLRAYNPGNDLDQRTIQ